MTLAVKIRQGFLKGPTLSETFRRISAKIFIHLPKRGSQQKSDSNKTRFFLSSDATWSKTEKNVKHKFFPFKFVSGRMGQINPLEQSRPRNRSQAWLKVSRWLNGFGKSLGVRDPLLQHSLTALIDICRQMTRLKFFPTSCAAARTHFSRVAPDWDLLDALPTESWQKFCDPRY